MASSSRACSARHSPISCSTDRRACPSISCHGIVRHCKLEIRRRSPLDFSSVAHDPPHTTRPQDRARIVRFSLTPGDLPWTLPLLVAVVVLALWAYRFVLPPLAPATRHLLTGLRAVALAALVLLLARGGRRARSRRSRGPLALHGPALVRSQARALRDRSPRRRRRGAALGRPLPGAPLRVRRRGARGRERFGRQARSRFDGARRRHCLALGARGLGRRGR